MGNSILLPSAVSTIAAAITVSTGIWAIYKLSWIGRREPCLPPGPPTVPLLGNLNIFPKDNAHHQFTKWAEEYGEVFSLKLGPGTIIVITSATAFRAFMDQNSHYTADRPEFYIPNTVSPGENHLVGAHYGERWRKLRRISHEVLTPQACARHLPIQHAEATQLMFDLLTYPTEFFQAVHRYTASSMFSIIYGKRAPRYATREVKNLFHVQKLWGRVLEPAAHPPVDLIPILKYAPEYFAPWKTLCKNVRRLQRALYFGLVNDVEARMVKGEANGCWMESLEGRADSLEINKEQIAYLGAALLEAATDTTSSFLLSFILAMVAFPNAQRKAQEEIDRVVGVDSMPTLDDLPNLPYVQAIIRETHRFRPVTPLLVPRANTTDIFYKGYCIPAGSTIFTNYWGMAHDQKFFKNAELFDPDRFLKNKFGVREELVDETKDWKEDLPFGSGRRSCPGIHFAKNSININALNLLWGFNISKPKDPNTGAEIEPDLDDYVKGTVAGPNPFKCSITPRSAQHAEIIKRQYQEATTVFEPFEHELSPEDHQFVLSQRKGF